MSLLKVVNDTVEKGKKLSEILFGSNNSTGNTYSSINLPPPVQVPDSTQMLQADIARSGIENEAASYLRPAPPMPHVPIPELPYRQPLPQGLTEREKRTQEMMDIIKRGEILPQQ